MNVNHVLEVENKDPVETLRSFLIAFWDRNQLEAILAPVELPQSAGMMTKQIENRAELARVNPFVPLMLSNAAQFVWQTVQDHPGTRMAAIMRPCELRAFIELHKRRGTTFDPEFFTILGVDCLGTFSRAEFSRCLETRSFKEVTGDILNNAAEGGLRTQRFRTACQVCDWPAPCGADATFGAIGVSTVEHLLIIVRDEKTDSRLDFAGLSSGLATEYQVSHRETVVGAIADMRAGVRKKMIEDMHASLRFQDLASFLAWIASCSLCGACISACPLYAGELDSLLGRSAPAQARSAPLAELVALSRWLASCSGCGMCEEACTCQVPLTLFISALSHRIRGEMHYRCGDPSQSLPWSNRSPVG